MSTVRPAAPAVTATPVGGGLVPATLGGPPLQVAPLSPGAGGGVGKPIASTGPQPCRVCGGDGFTFHTSPTNGAVELDGPCPACTGRTPR